MVFAASHALVVVIAELPVHVDVLFFYPSFLPHMDVL